MKALLVNPPMNIFNTRMTLPLGLGYIAAVLEKEGNDVKILDMTVEEISDNKLRNAIGNADFVGVTSTTPTINNAWKICKMAKEEGVMSILGGPHPSALPEESLSKCDVVVRGEGELTILDIVKRLEHKENMKKIRGISYRYKGKNIHMPNREFIKNIDEIPFPAFHLFPRLDKYSTQQPLLDKKVLSGNIMTSRGCPFNCIFCFKEIFGTTYRFRSPENVVEEWRMLVEEYKIKEMGVVDDSFTSIPKRAIEICKLLVKEKLEVDWLTPSGIRIKPISKELLTWMKKAGCKRVAFGIESGSQKILDLIGKHVTLADIEHAVKIAKEVGIETLAFFMIGNYGEDEESMQETIDFAKKVDTDYAQFLVTVPYPGTRLYDIIKHRGKFLTTNWDEYGTFEDKVYFELDNVNEELVKRMHKKAYRSFYMRPKYVLSKTLSIKTLLNLPNYTRAFLKWIS